MTGATDSFDPYRDAAQAMVTAVLAEDRDLAVKIAGDTDDPVILAFVLADLTAYTHRRWMRAVKAPADKAMEAWQMLMLDIEAWRAGR